MTSKTCAVTFGNFMGHIGHRYLIDQMHEFGADSNFVYVGPKVGYDDPLSVGLKLDNLTRFQIPNVTYSTWNETQSPLKKIEFELFASRKYKTIFLIVGDDRYSKFQEYFLKSRIETLKQKYHVDNEIQVIGLSRKYVPITSTQIRQSIRQGDYSKMNEWFPQNDVWQNVKIINQVCYHKYL
jgi:FAD synthase